MNFYLIYFFGGLALAKVLFHPQKAFVVREAIVAQNDIQKNVRPTFITSCGTPKAMGTFALEKHLR